MNNKKKDPNELTLKQERFCQEYTSNGGNASEAYRNSYKPKKMKTNSLNVQASRMLDIPKIALRIKQLTEKHNKKYDITREYLTKGLIAIVEDITKFAEAKKVKLSAQDLRRKAIMDLGKLHGLIIEKTDNTNRNFNLTPTLEWDGKEFKPRDNPNGNADK